MALLLCEGVDAGDTKKSECLIGAGTASGFERRALHFRRLCYNRMRDGQQFGNGHRTEFSRKTGCGRQRANAGIVESTGHRLRA
jgi:hypothetical protein